MEIVIKEISFDEIFPIWQEHLWPDRESAIKPVSSIKYGTHPFQYDDPQLVKKFNPTFFGAFDGDKLIGVNSGYKQFNTYRSRGLFVMTEYRKHGIGIMLLEATKQAAKDSGAHIFWSMPNRRAINTYRSVDFKITSDWFETETGVNCFVSYDLNPANEKVFHEGWAGHHVFRGNLMYNLNIPPEQMASLVESNYDDYKKLAVNNALEQVGDNPAIMLSGGIDSQAMVSVFIQAGHTVKPVIIRYPGFNDYDVMYAIKFCSKHNLEYNLIDFDAYRFILRESVSFGRSFNLRSPQFATHAKVCDILKGKGYTGALFGGSTIHHQPVHGIMFGMSSAQLLDLVEYGEQIDWPIIGSFHSHTWEHCLAISLIDTEVNEELEMMFRDDNVNLFNDDLQKRYDLTQQQSYKKYSKYIGEENLILPTHKKTGFEEIREKIRDVYNQYVFDTKFRVPLTQKTPDFKPNSGLIMTTSQLGMFNGTNSNIQ